MKCVVCRRARYHVPSLQVHLSRWSKHAWMLQAPGKWAKINLAEHMGMDKFSAHIAPYGGRCTYNPEGMDGTDILVTFRDGRKLRVSLTVVSQHGLLLTSATASWL